MPLAGGNASGWRWSCSWHLVAVKAFWRGNRQPACRERTPLIRLVINVNARVHPFNAPVGAQLDDQAFRAPVPPLRSRLRDRPARRLLQLAYRDTRQAVRQAPILELHRLLPVVSPALGGIRRREIAQIALAPRRLRARAVTYYLQYGALIVCRRDIPLDSYIPPLVVNILRNPAAFAYARAVWCKFRSAAL